MILPRDARRGDVALRICATAIAVFGGLSICVSGVAALWVFTAGADRRTTLAAAADGRTALSVVAGACILVKRRLRYRFGGCSIGL
jgi:hypothetical protein